MSTDLRLPGRDITPLWGLLLIALFIFLYLAVLGVRPLFIPDEARYGEIAREMIANHNWVVPRLNGLLYFEKPPFGHWMNAISLLLFGENQFAVRFASALCAGGSAYLVFLTAKYLFASRFVPVLAAFVLLTTLEVQIIGTTSVLDTMFSFFLNVGIALFVAGAYSQGRHRTLWLASSGLLFGIAFLTKGFLAFVLPALILVPWLLIQKKYRLLLKQSWVSVAAALLAVLPWAIAIHQQQPDFWHYFFWVEHVQRFAAENAQHKEPFYYFLVLLPFVAFPWIFLLPGALRGLRTRDGSQDRQGAVLLLALWSLLPLLFFSIAKGKLLTYILPCFAPFSLLMAIGLEGTLTNLKAHKKGLALAAAIVAISIAALIYVFVRPAAEPVFVDSDAGKFVALLATSLLAFLILAYSYATRNTLRRVLLVGLSMLPLLIALPMSLPELVMASKAPIRYLETEYGHLSTETTIVSKGSFVRAVAWALKRDDIYVIEQGGEVSYGLQADDGQGRFLTTKMFADLTQSGNSILLLCKSGCKSETLEQLPENAIESSYGNFSGYLLEPTGEAIQSEKIRETLSETGDGH